jgi:hypothetical protein
MKQTQNQFYGLDVNKARKATPGSMYVASDTRSLYVYDRNGDPRKVNSAATGTATIVDTYADLDPFADPDSIAFVLYDTGTAWLPGSLGGTYYPMGWYAFLNNVWVSDSKFIDQQLAQFEILIAANATAISDHVADLANPHQVSKVDLGLGNVDNTADIDKPISGATQIALNLKADSNHNHVKADITDFNDADYATSAQGLLANTALQPGDDISQLFNDQVYLQPADNISALTNDAGYIQGNIVTSYRSDVTGSTVYSGYLLNSVITIKKCVEGVETFGQNLTNLETDWTNRLSLTYI